MNISRRDLFALGGGAAAAGLLAPIGTLHAASDKVAADTVRELGRVKIRDVQSATIMDEYPCNLEHFKFWCTGIHRIQTILSHRW